MTENLENMSVLKTDFSNGVKIPLDEVFVFPGSFLSEVDFNGQLLAESSLEVTATGRTQAEATKKLKNKALRHIANALVEFCTTVCEGVFTAKGRLALVAVPIGPDEISPVNLLFRLLPGEASVPTELFFTEQEAIGSAEKPVLETRFVSLEEAKESACVTAFKQNTAIQPS